MMMVLLFRIRTLGVFAACLLAGLAIATPSYANAPWWHLSSASRPTYLQQGHARSGIQTLTVSATEGGYQLERPRGGRARLAVGETPEQVQTALEEELYGAGNVRVTGGHGVNATNEYEVYEIEFTGELADQSIESMEVVEARLKRFTGGVEEIGEASVTQITQGRPDGQILVTAVNLGDANADPATQPISIADQLPVGLKAVAIEGYVDEKVTLEDEFPMECTMVSSTCTFTGKNSKGATSVPPYEQIQMRISVVLQPGAKSGEVNEAGISGGGAPGATAKQPLIVSDSPIPF